MKTPCLYQVPKLRIDTTTNTTIITSITTTISTTLGHCLDQGEVFVKTTCHYQEPKLRNITTTTATTVAAATTTTATTNHGHGGFQDEVLAKTPCSKGLLFGCFPGLPDVIHSFQRTYK